MPAEPDLKDLIADYEKMVKENHVPCLISMQPQFLEYRHQELLTMSFPVLPNYMNPRRTMQGGFIAAAFDNIFGALAHYSTGEKAMATIDLQTHFHAPIFEGDTLTMTAHVNSLGKSIVSLRGEAYDKNGRLIATATTDLFLLDRAGNEQ